MSSGAEIHPATLWERIAEIADDRPAIIQADVSRSWREFDDRAARLAGVLWDAGLRPGSRVGIYLPNALEYLEAWYAAFKIRCIPVNINYRYVADELAYLLDDSGSEALVFPSSLSGHVAEVLADRDVKAVLQVAGDGDHLIEGATRFDEAVASAEPKDTMEREEQDHYIVYTGGTTGLPKGVVYEIGPLLAELAAIIGPFTGSGEVSGAGDVVDNARNAIEAGTSLTGMILPPLMHGTGIALALGALITGGTVVLSAEGSFEPGAALDAVENTGATFLVVVGDAFMRPLLEELEARRERGHPADLSTVTLVMSSGAMLSEASKSSFLEHAPQAILVDQLAASEGAMGSSITTAGGGPGTAAFSLRPGTRVLDENDVDVEPGSGASGLVAVPTDNPIGYFNDPEKTAATFRTLDGVKYSFPGDHAVVEADGTIKLLGRGNNCINTGGEKVYPEEVEEALKAHSSVMDALVFGVDDAKWGQRIEAVVSSRDGSGDPTVEDLQAHVRQSLAGYKAPKSIVFVDTVPRGPNGKADYRAARALAGADQP